jgi:formimidoylglutamate deiminase
MGERMVAAAKEAGIKITLVPVFYQKGGFDLDPQPRQRRFISTTVDDYFKLLEASANIVKGQSHANLGYSVHSLRAVNPKDIVRTYSEGPKDLPFHLHIAEQLKEVEDCIHSLKKRPVEWLLDNLPVNERFHVIHATHLNDNEVKGLASSKATVVLCPSTEGNLGDGIFRMRDYVKQNGNWCTGTDSHIGLNPLEEFRMIDYRQRLVTHQRNTFEGEGARYMINAEIENGRMAMGVNTKDHFAINQPLDCVVADAKSPLVLSTSLSNLLSTIVYSSDASIMSGTLVNGKWVVKNQHHQNRSRIAKAFSTAMMQLKNR